MKFPNTLKKFSIKFMTTTLFCLYFQASFACAGEVYFCDDFDDGLSKWEVAGDAWQITELFCRSCNYCVSDSPQGNYPAYANSAMTMKINFRVDLSNSRDPILTFWHKIGVYDGDYGYVEISEDYGFTWKVIESFTNTWRSTWSCVQVDLIEYKTTPILIRFRLRSNGRDESWGWDIDDVEIKEKDIETLLFPFCDNFESGLTNWLLEEGDAWQLRETLYRDPNHCISESTDGAYPSYSCSDLILAHPIDLSSSDEPVLTFWYQIGVYSGDHGYVHISEDGGTTWSELKDFTNTWRSTWIFQQIDLSAYKSSPILIRFRLRSNRRDESWGWDIDNIEIKEKDPETIPFPFYDDFESGLDNWRLEEGDAWQLAEEADTPTPSRTHFISESSDGAYPSYASSDLILAHPIDLSSSEIPALTFWHRIGVYDGDHGYVQISEDGGTTWSKLADLTYVWYSTWTYEQIDLSDYRSSPILIRFRLRSNRRDETWGWDIDNVMIDELIDHPLPFLVRITNIDTSYCPEIQASVMITDMDDEPVVDLDASHFTVNENTEMQSPITVVLSSSGVSASLALDYSGSMGDYAIDAMENAAISFVDLMENGDNVEIIKFAHGVEVMQEYSELKEKSDWTDVNDAILNPPILKTTHTTLYDAIYQAISDTVDQQGNKAVIVMTDGKNNYSEYDPEYSATDVIKHAKANGASVFTIGLGSSVEADTVDVNNVDESALRPIATNTGGLYYFAPSPEDLKSIYKEIAGILKAQYLVIYTTNICDPKSTDDIEHELNIEVSRGMAYGHDTRRFRCPVLKDPNEVLDYNTDSLDPPENNVVPLVIND